MPECLKNRAVMILILCQALSMSVMTVILSISSNIGLTFIKDSTYYTLPVTLFIFGTFIMLFPASYLCGLWGRRNAFILGACFGIAGGGVLYLGLVAQSFAMIGTGILLVGFQFAFAQYYRFAVSELVPDNAKAFAMSLVVGGGVFASFLGPWLVKLTVINDSDFTQTAWLVAALCTVQIILFFFYKNIAADTIAAQEKLEIPFHKAQLFLALFISICGFSLMTILMNAAPVAMQHTYHMHFHQSVTAIQWHIFSMYAPSFLTGPLIKRFGPFLVSLLGIGIFLAASMTASFDSGYASFVITLILAGIGWNFCYLAGSYLLVQASPAQYKSTIQGINDVIIYSVNVAGSLSAGIILTLLGWQGLNMLLLGIICLLGIIYFYVGKRYLTRRSA